MSKMSNFAPSALFKSLHSIERDANSASQNSRVSRFVLGFIYIKYLSVNHATHLREENKESINVCEFI